MYDFDLRLAAGHYLIAAVRMEEAVLNLERAAALDPSNPWSAVDLGRMYMAERAYDRATVSCQQALAIDPDFMPAQRVLYSVQVLELLEPDQMLIVWKDGRECLYTYQQLRLQCTCAGCVDEWSGKPLLDPTEISEDVRVTSWNPTGHYGIGLSFSDGHATGIYTFRHLREICEN